MRLLHSRARRILMTRYARARALREGCLHIGLASAMLPAWMKLRARIAAPLAVLVVVSSALGTVLDCGMHRLRDDQATSGQGLAAHRDDGNCHSAANAWAGSHREGAPGSHNDHHRSGPPCCHVTLYNAVPLSVSGLDALQATASARRSHEFTTLSLPSALASPGKVAGHGAGPPGPSFPSARLFPGRQLFLAVSSLLL